MGIPVFLAIGSEYVVPEWLVESVVTPVMRVPPYYALLFGAVLVYLPFGLNMLYKIKITKGKINNMAPRQQTDSLRVTHPAFARLVACEKNMQEGFMIFAPAVLAALQAGVTKETVSLYASFWLLVRFLFIVIYAIQFNAMIAAIRSILFGFSLAASCKLFYLAAAM